MNVGKGEIVMLSLFSNGKHIDACMNVGLNFELIHSKLVEVPGTKYYCGCSLVAGVENEQPLLVKLLHILSRNQEHCWFARVDPRGGRLVCHPLKG